MLKGSFKKYWGLFLVILLSFWAIKPLFHQGFFPMHDDTQVVRIAQMAKALRDGQFPVRWVSDLGYGYGYPLFNFYAPLPYYVGAFFQLTGFGALIATKFMFGVGILLSGVFMYFLAREFWGELGGLLSAILYQYAPYHAVDIYIRGAVGEFYALAFLPLVAYGFLKTYQIANSKNQKYKSKFKNSGKYIGIGSLGYAGVILSHNITAMILSGFIIIVSLFHCFIVSLRERKFIIHYSLFIILLGLGLSAFFWLPAIWEVKYTNVSAMIEQESNFREHFLYLDQLWDSPWGFAGSARGRADGMSFKIGKLHIILAIAGVLSLVYSWGKKKIEKMVQWFNGSMVLLLIFSIFMTTEYSRIIWEAIPPLVYTQYPWRFLVFIIFTVSFLGGSLTLTFQFLPKRSICRILSKTGVFSVVVLIIMINAKYFQPQKFLSVRAEDYLSEENVKWRTSRISDEYLPKDFSKPKTKEETVKDKIILEEDVRLLNQEIKSHRYELVVDSKHVHNVLMRIAYFPGWEVFVDKQRFDFSLVDDQILIFLSSGKHDVVVKFTNTSVRTLSNLISLVSFVFVVMPFMASKILIRVQ